MAGSERRVHRGTRRALAALHELGTQFREARLSAGLSQAQLGRSSGISAAQVGRIERAEAKGAAVTTLARTAAVLGLDLSLRLYPVSDPTRDAGHVQLLERMKRTLPDTLRWRYEVPIRHGPGELRAWDAEVGCVDGPVEIEAETRLRDIQALDRRLALKIEDGGAERVILLVADTRTNRDALRASKSMLRARFPIGQAETLESLREGRRPAGSGIVML